MARDGNLMAAVSLQARTTSRDEALYASCNKREQTRLKPAGIAASVNLTETSVVHHAHRLGMVLLKRLSTFC